MSDVADKLQPLLETLVRLTDEMGLCLTGFVFGITPPVVIHFGNLTESQDPEKLKELYKELLNIYEENYDRSKVIKLDPDRKDWSN